MRLDGGNIEAMRIACGGVQCTPRRLSAVEALVRGRPADEETAKLAGAAAVEGARPLQPFKIPLIVTVAVTDGRVVPQGQSRWSTPKIRPVRLQCRSQAFDILGRSSTDDVEVLGQDDWNE